MISSSENNECYLFYGVSGAGKSSTINTLCGRVACDVGQGAGSATKHCKLIRIEKQASIFHGKVLMDMPGFNDTRPEENLVTMFTRIKLDFLRSKIKQVKCIIFVVSILDSRTDHYRLFAQFLGKLFSQEEVQKNALILLTKGDELAPSAKEKRIIKIKENLSDLENNYNWSMETVEWSNEDPSSDQESKLYDVISKCSGFDATAVLKEEERKIDEEVEKQYEATENINIVKHEEKMELQEFKVDQEVEENLVVQCDEVRETYIPAQKSRNRYPVTKTIHFTGQMIGSNNFGGALARGAAGLGGVIGSNYIVCGLAGRQTKKQIKKVEFEEKVISVLFDKDADDVHLLDKLFYQISTDNPKLVTVVAEFSWGGSPQTTWDFDLSVTAVLEREYTVRDAYKETKIIPKQRVETIKKVVTNIDKRMVKVADAYEEKLYKRTKEDIKKSIIDNRIFKMT